MHGGCILQAHELHLFVAGFGLETCQVGDAQHIAVAVQALAQFGAEAAGCAGEQQSFETDGVGCSFWSEDM